MLRLTVVTLLAAVLLGGACGSRSDIFETPVRFATLADLTGPWQRFPSRLDPVMRERVADACRREIELAPGSIPAVIDTRGAGVVTPPDTGGGRQSRRGRQPVRTRQVLGSRMLERL